MADLFIPPEGAMQFELKPDYAKIKGCEFLWVTPHPDPTMKCPDGRSPCYLSTYGTIICLCGGRIIE